RATIAADGGGIVPGVSLDLRDRHTLSPLIKQAEIELRVDDAGVRSATEQSRCLIHAPLHPGAVEVSDAEVERGIRISLRGSLLIPLDRLGRIAADTKASLVQHRDIVLRLGDAPFGGGFE